jgi:hypothetical protein
MSGALAQTLLRVALAARAKPVEATPTPRLGAASLDGYADALGVAQNTELGNTYFDARTRELVENQPRKTLGETFHEPESLLREHVADALDHDAVVDGIGNLPGAEYGVSRQRDLDVELDRLRRDFLVAVQADPSFEPQFAYEYGVHVQSCAPGARARRETRSIAIGVF